jgi:hypothetical protein
MVQLHIIVVAFFMMQIHQGAEKNPGVIAFRFIDLPEINSVLYELDKRMSMIIFIALAVYLFT